MLASSHPISCRVSGSKHKLYRRSTFIAVYLNVLAGLASAQGAVAGDLHDAVRANDLERAVLLLEAGEAIDETDFMLGTALHVAVAQGSVPLAKILISHGADIEAPSEDRESRAIHLAANFGDVEMLNLLLDAGADIEAQDQRGQTPLLLAAATNNTKVVKVLIGRGANKAARELEKGMTPLMRACRLGFLKIAVVLVENGAEINAVDSSGFSPLQLAATENSYVNVGGGVLIEYLVKNGADLNFKNQTGYTALSWARDATNSSTYREILEVLRRLGARE